MSVLVVDDEPDTLESLRDVLSQVDNSIQIHLAASGPQALDVLEAQPVDVIISDYRLPGMDGLELLTRVRREAPGIERVLITAYPDLGVAVGAINEGEVRRFFTKPVEGEALVKLVHDLRAKRASRVSKTQALARGMDTMRRRQKRPDE